MDFQLGQYYARSLTPWAEWNETDDYITNIVAYDPNKQIEQQHDMPRFGRTNDIASLYEEGNKDKQREYIAGIAIGAVFILVVSIVWFIVILILNCLGEKRVGFFAGHFTHPSATNEAPEEGGSTAVKEKEQQHDTDNPSGDPVAEEKFKRRVMTVRVMFVCCGIAVIVSGLIFYLKGIAMFKGSLRDVHTGIDQIQDVVTNAINFTDTIFDVQTKLDMGVRLPGDENEEICNLNEQICALRPQICAKNEEISGKVRDTIIEVMGQIKELRGQLDSTLGGASADLQKVLDMSEDIETYLKWSNIFFIVLITITVVLSALIIAMIAGVFFAWKGIQNGFTKCIQYAIIWPIFVLILVLSWVFAMLFLVTSIAGSDFCMDPDAHVQAILERVIYGSDGSSMVESIMVDLVMFYIAGCVEQNPARDMFLKIEGLLGNARTSTHQLLTLMEDLPVETLVQVCRMSDADATALRSLADLADKSTHLLQRVFVGLMDVLRCKTFHSIYSIFVHSAFCLDGVSGMAYIFEASIVVAVFSMLMIMLRAAMYPVKEPAASSSGDLEIVEAVKYQSSGNELDTAKVSQEKTALEESMLDIQPTEAAVVESTSSSGVAAPATNVNGDAETGSSEMQKAAIDVGHEADPEPVTASAPTDSIAK